METFVAWIQDNHLPLLGVQLAVVLTVGLVIAFRRLRAAQASAEMEEPAEGDRRTVVLPEEDAAQMFETLTALQEELERYRKTPAREEEAAAEPVVEDLTVAAPPRPPQSNEMPFWDEEVGAQEAFASAVTEKTEVAPEAPERPESEPMDAVSPADRVLRNWLEDVERLARRARRDSL